jgi:DUF4097 and DUF4098 domain-containing protein YvlB
MTQEQHVPLTDLRRINVEVEVRDIAARWSERDDVLVRGEGFEAFIEAEELFIGSTRERSNNQGKIELELPLQPLNCTFKVQSGDISLQNAQGRLDTRLDSGDLSVSGGSGNLNVANGKGDLKVDTFAGDVTVHSGSGDKILSDVTGDIVVGSGKGDIKITRGRGGAIISSASGDLVLTDRDTTSLTVTSASGDVVIRGGRLGQSAIETASGDIVCQAALTIATYDVTAASGDMVLNVQHDLPARVDAATTRGTITSDLPLVAIAQRGPRNPHGKRVVGSTSHDPNRAEITLRTSSGDIRILWSAEASVPVTVPERRRENAQTEAIPLPAQPARPTSDDDDRRRVILAALADGSLSVEEASQLLDAMGRSGNSTSGAR